jgi:hypothetical protein
MRVAYLDPDTYGISRKLGRLAEQKLADSNLDEIFAPAGFVMFAKLRTSIPTAYLSDASFRLMNGYCPEFGSPASGTRPRHAIPSAW